MINEINVDPAYMLDYMNWANDRVLSGARQLSPDLLNAPIRPGFLSALGLLVHILSAERMWLSRWQGESPTRLLTVDDYPTLDALVAAWEPLRAEMRDFVARVDDPNRVVQYSSTKGEKFSNIWWHLFLHICNHGTEHRSQVALYLATQGIDLGNLDMTAYIRTLR